MEKDSMPESAVAADQEELDEEVPAPWDSQERATMRCRSCQLPRIFRRRKIHHSFHFMLAMGTLGLWLPVWGVLIVLQLLKPWACTICGIHQRN